MVNIRKEKLKIIPKYQTTTGIHDRFHRPIELDIHRPPIPVFHHPTTPFRLCKYQPHPEFIHPPYSEETIDKYTRHRPRASVHSPSGVSVCTVDTERRMGAGDESSSRTVIRHIDSTMHTPTRSTETACVPYMPVITSQAVFETQWTPYASLPNIGDHTKSFSLQRLESLQHRNELAVTRSRYVALYKAKYYNVKISTGDSMQVRRHRVRAAWKKIVMFLRKAVVDETGSYCRYRPINQSWFLLYNNTPVCPLLRFQKRDTLVERSRVRVDRLECMLSPYVTRIPCITSFTCLPKVAMPNINDVFRLQLKPRSKFTRSERTMQLADLTDARKDNFKVLTKGRRRLRGIMGFWTLEAKTRLRQTYKRVGYAEREFYEDILTVDGKIRLPIATRDVGLQISESSIDATDCEDWRPCVTAWEGFFKPKPPKYLAEDDKEVRAVRFRRIPLPKITHTHERRFTLFNKNEYV